MIQGVREVFEISASKARPSGAASGAGTATESGSGWKAQQTQEQGRPPVQEQAEIEGKMVIIGKDVAGKPWADSLGAWLASEQ